jgi:ESCRT-II complex subunit VPS36
VSVVTDSSKPSTDCHSKFKIAACQKGHAYLTSHRACYVDDEDPRNCSLAVDLKDVERHEYQAGFLRSSAKVTLHPKPPKRGYGTLRQHIATPAVQRVASSSSPVSRTPSPFPEAQVRASTPQLDRGTWICTICSFPNPVPSNFDPTIATQAFPLPPCLTCGIKPEYPHVLKAAITANSKRGPALASSSSLLPGQTIQNGLSAHPVPQDSITCPRCTFHNHPSLQNCEICGADLPRSGISASQPDRPTSPGPEIANLNLDDESYQSIKFSFRAGGDKMFYERLKNAMVQRKWLLQQAPPVPRPDQDTRSTTPDIPGSPTTKSQSTSVGIAGLERRGLATRRNNEVVLGSAFEDLEALMASAKDIVALAEKFAHESGTGSSNPLLTESASAMGIMTTKAISGESSNAVYINGLSRDLAEYVTDPKAGILRDNGGIIALVDFWALVNGARNGFELISPADFHQAAVAWEHLNLPVRLREFRSGLLVVQARDWTDEKAINQITSWLKSLQVSPPEEPPAWDWMAFGCGVTAQEAASRFGWKIGVATEELEMAEEKGAVCREEGIEGLKFWLNFLVDTDDDLE